MDFRGSGAFVGRHFPAAGCDCLAAAAVADSIRTLEMGSSRDRGSGTAADCIWKFLALLGCGACELIDSSPEKGIACEPANQDRSEELSDFGRDRLRRRNRL